MKRFLPLVFLLMFLPIGFASAHKFENTEIPTFDSCTTVTVDTCPEYKAYLLDLLIQLIEAIREARAEKAEAAETDPEVSITEDRIVVDISRSEARDLRDTTYRVLSSGALSGESRGDVPDVVLAIWNDFKSVAPEEYVTEYIQSLRAYYDEDDVTAAYVETDRDDYTKWILGVNVADYVNDRSTDKRNYLQVLVHEFGHILTLNDEQLDLTVRERNCQNYHPGEGCSATNSYLNLFVEEFWEEEDFEHSEDFEREEDPDERDDIARDFFEENDDEYVTAYATTHPVEDLAESFAFYVFEEIPSRIRDEVDEKLLFFDDFVEMREIRTNIRNTFTTIF